MQRLAMLASRRPTRAIPRTAVGTDPRGRGRRERKLLLAVVAVSSGLTISCSARGIGLYDSGWNSMFDAAARDAAQDANDSHDATADAPSDASDATDASAH
jgi:hypothetical protein